MLSFFYFFLRNRIFYKKSHTLFYIPEALFEIHFVTMNYLAECYKLLGNNILLPICDSKFSLCPPFVWLPQNSTESQKVNQCASCRSFANEAVKIYSRDSLLLEEFLNEFDIEIVEKELRRYTNNLLDYKFNSISFGRLTSYQFVLLTKISNFEDLTKEQSEIWKKLILTAIRSYFHVKFLSRKKLLKCIVYYNFYATEIGAIVAAKELKIKSMYVVNISHRWVDRKNIYICNPNDYYLLTKDWIKWREFELKPSQIKESFEDLLINYFSIGSHRYSPKREQFDDDLREKLNIPKNKKILSAFTSSDDERLGLNFMFNEIGFESIEEKTDCFIDQIDWLENLIDWIESREDFYLVIRIHPRSGKNNQGDTNNTQFYNILLEKFNIPYKNTLIVHPQELISSYSLIDISDVCLVSWSSIGLDVARLGGKCLSALKLIPSYPDDIFVYYEKEKSSYFDRIIQLSNEKLNIDSVIYAYRWYYYSRFSLTYSFDKISKNKDFQGFPKAKENKSNLVKLQKVFDGKKIKNLNYLERRRGNKIEEEYMFRYLLSLFLHFSFVGIENVNIDYDNLNIDINNFKFEGDILTYNFEGKLYKNFSRLNNNILNYCKNYDSKNNITFK